MHDFCKTEQKRCRAKLDPYFRNPCYQCKTVFNTSKIFTFITQNKQHAKTRSISFQCFIPYKMYSKIPPPKTCSCRVMGRRDSGFRLLEFFFTNKLLDNVMQLTHK